MSLRRCQGCEIEFLEYWQACRTCEVLKAHQAEREIYMLKRTDTLIRGPKKTKRKERVK